MKSILSVIVAMIVGVTVAGTSPKAGAKLAFPTKEEIQAIPRVKKEEVKSMLGEPNVIILDIRFKPHWEKSKIQIPGAVYEDPIMDVKKWIDKYPKDKMIVLYCD